MPRNHAGNSRSSQRLLQVFRSPRWLAHPGQHGCWVKTLRIGAKGLFSWRQEKQERSRETLNPPIQRGQEGRTQTTGDSPSTDREDVQGFGAPPISRARVMHQARSRISKTLFIPNGRRLLAHMKARAGTVTGQRAVVCYPGAEGKGATAWATCRGVDNRERGNPAVFRDILARNVGSHDQDEIFGCKCHEGCGTPSCLTDTLTWIRGGHVQTHTHQPILVGSSKGFCGGVGSP